MCCPTEAGTAGLPGSATVPSATISTTVIETVVADEKEDISKASADGWGGWEAVAPPLEEDENEDYIPFEVEAEEGADEDGAGEVGDDEVADAEPAEKEESEEELLARWVNPKALSSNSITRTTCIRYVPWCCQIGCVHNER